MKKIDLAYIAGIVDGEGCIRIRKNFVLNVSVSNTNEWLIQWLKFSFGGYTYKPTFDPPRKKALFTWQLQGKAAGEFLILILPYLHLKRPQAELGLLFQGKKTERNIGRKGRGRGMSEEEKAVEEAQRLLMKKMKRV